MVIVLSIKLAILYHHLTRGSLTLTPKFKRLSYLNVENKRSETKREPSEGTCLTCIVRL
jgi:hypothetical protein